MKTATFEEILATRARAFYRYRVNFTSVSLDNVKKMNRWCDENCQGMWHSESYFALYWQFEEEKDATMFMLKWANFEGNVVK